MTKAQLPWMLAAFILPLLILRAEASGQKSTEPTQAQWTAYMKDVQVHVKKYWAPRATYMRSHTVAVWVIHNDGSVSNIRIKDHGSCTDEDLAAITRQSMPLSPQRHSLHCPGAHQIVACSGELGPKLKEGDMQVPEGFYKTSALDAGTHRCLWVDYPNREDKANARADHRTTLGGNIQIHEGVYSTGCVVLSHDDMAELFVLAHDAGINNISLIIAPCNLLVKEPPIDLSKQPKWLPKLYKNLRKELASFQLIRQFHIKTLGDLCCHPRTH
jgi:hypothetical protein